jgi:hypothetical protein
MRDPLAIVVIVAGIAGAIAAAYLFAALAGLVE